MVLVLYQLLLVSIGCLTYAMVLGILLVAAFALSTVLSSTDALALSGIVGKGRIPKPIMGLLEDKH